MLECLAGAMTISRPITLPLTHQRLTMSPKMKLRILLLLELNFAALILLTKYSCTHCLTNCLSTILSQNYFEYIGPYIRSVTSGQGSCWWMSNSRWIRGSAVLALAGCQPASTQPKTWLSACRLTVTQGPHRPHDSVHTAYGIIYNWMLSETSFTAEGCAQVYYCM